MSTLPGNPMGEKYGDSKGLSAEVVSALIIAHELRTANLIALVQLAVSIDGPSVDLTNDFKDIAERIGQHEAEAEADRVKLEQEALVLFKASGAYGSDRSSLKFSDLDEHVQQCWLAVARAARELNKETGQ